MLVIKKEEIARQLSECIWDFKIGDNISYNLKILFSLYSYKEKDGNNVLNKPIVIFLVSIIEALLVDLLRHLDEGTFDFPFSINIEKAQQIKNKISSQKKSFTRKDEFLETEYTYRRIKNYNFNEILSLYEEYELLGPKGHLVYKKLEEFSWLRNRIHITNYHNNFEKDESGVFTNERVFYVENIFVNLLDYISVNYPRKIMGSTKESLAKDWLKVFQA